MFRLFEGNEHAKLYKKYRRTTPKFLVDKILHWMQQEPEGALQSTDPIPLVQAFDVAVDVGCGSGQNTLSFAPYFERVYGFDVSEAQVVEARRHLQAGSPGNVSFDVAPAEKLPLPDSSVQLVTGSFSFHWFDLDSFYPEVDRVLAPNGVVAAVGHTTMKVVHETKSEELNQLMRDFVSKVLQEEMHQRNDYVFNLYRDLPLPYKEERRIQNLPLEIRRTLADVLGAYSSWSSFQALYREDPQKMIANADKFRDQFLRILDLDVSTPVDQVPLVLRYEYFVAMCRKPGVATNEQAALYKLYRPTTPKFLVDRILHWMQHNPGESTLLHSTDPVPLTHAFDLAVDVGCGSGQNTVSIAPYFQRVYAYDVSEAQVAEARRQLQTDSHVNNVTYEVGPAEKLPLPDSSVQLVMGSLSFHWFDLDRFYAEMDRVLVPKGVMAAVGHTPMTVVHETKGDQLNQLMREFWTKTLKERMDKRTEYVFNAYRDLPLPYKDEQRIQNLPLEIHRTFAYVLGAYASWSVVLYKEDPENGIAASDKFRDQFLRILDLDVSTPVEQVPLVLRYEYFVAMCRKPDVVI